MKRHASITCLLSCLAACLAHSASPAAEGNSTAESTNSEPLAAGNFERQSVFNKYLGASL
jgi:hypothetical protein